MGRRSVDSGGRSCCELCRFPRGALLCSTCVNSVVVGDKKALLEQLHAQRDELLKQLDRRLALRDTWERQGAELGGLEEQLRAVSIEATSRERKLRQLRRNAALLAQKNEMRAKAIAEQMNELGNKRTEVLVHHFSDVIRCQGLRHSMVLEQLVTEQRRRLQALLHIFPLQITALRSSTGSTNGSETVLPIPCVTVANLRLPDSSDQMLESSQHTQVCLDSRGRGEKKGWPSHGCFIGSSGGATHQSVSAALGYMLLLTQLLAHYLGAPLSHVATFGASTSLIWEPASAREPRPAPPDRALPLYPLSKAASPASSSEATAGGSGRGAREAGGEQVELRRGVQLLERSVAMICHAKMGPAVAACPEDWNAFALLAWMFAQVNLQHTESTQRIVAAAGVDVIRHPPPSLQAAAPSDAGAAENRWSGNDAGLCAQMLLGDPCAPEMAEEGGGAEEEGEADDWDLVQRPFLPPPPSQPDEVEHWTRAMFTDASSRVQGSGDSFTKALRQKMPSFTSSGM